jgi:hypothetical protein
MSDKTALRREANDAFAELRQAIEGLGEEPMHRVWLGSWGVREILIHISGWHRAMIPALAHVTRGEEPYPPGTYDDFDAWNARFVADKAGVKVVDVLAELGASHEDFMAAVAAVPPSEFGEGGTTRGLLDGAGTGHYREHTAQIRDWRRAAAV